MYLSTSVRILALAVPIWMAGSTWVAAQAGPRKTPAANPEMVRRGSLMYRARCAGCHGLDAKGVSGPDLTAVLAAGMSDDRFFRTVRNGQGTDMPRFSTEQNSDAQVWEILSHLRSLSAATPSESVPGNATNGRTIFAARCAGCHRANGAGGALGPDLSRVGALRSPTAISAKVRDPNRARVPGYEPVTLVLADGAKVRGLVKNEDAFSIQIMDSREQIRGFLKGSVRETVREPRSAMPPFGAEQLNDGDLRDLVSYLTTLRGSAAVAQ
jgi:putative heme-binding domain-containing protein